MLIEASEQVRNDVRAIMEETRSTPRRMAAILGVSCYAMVRYLDGHKLEPLERYNYLRDWLKKPQQLAVLSNIKTGERLLEQIKDDFRELMRTLNVSQTELGHRMGISPSRISTALRGLRPGLAKLVTIREKLNAFKEQIKKAEQLKIVEKDKITITTPDVFYNLSDVIKDMQVVIDKYKNELIRK